MSHENPTIQQRFNLIEELFRSHPDIAQECAVHLDKIYTRLQETSDALREAERLNTITPLEVINTSESLDSTGLKRYKDEKLINDISLLDPERAKEAINIANELYGDTALADSRGVTITEEVRKRLDEIPSIPGDCILVAVDTGDGYALYVEDGKKNVIAELKWPDSWPSVISPSYLHVAGFRVH